MKEMINVQKKSIKDYLYSDKVKSFVFVLFLALEFIFAVRVGYGILDAQKAYWAIALFVLYMALEPNMTISVIDFPGIILCIIYFIIGIHQQMTEPLLAPEWDPTPYTWLVPTIYILGRVCVGSSKRKLDEKSFMIIASLTIGMYIQSLLNYYEIFMTFHRDVSIERQGVASQSFWNPIADGTKNTWAYGFMIAVGVMFYLFYKRKEHKKTFIFFCFANIVSLGLTLFFACRQVFLVTVLINFILFILYMFLEKKNFLVFHKRKIFVGLSIILLIIFLFYVLFLNNAFGIADKYNNSFLSRDGGILNNVRFQMWRSALIKAFTLKKGGWTISDLYGTDTCHNAWIDYSRLYDVCVFILWVVFLVTSFANHFKVLFRYSKKYPVLYMTMGAELALFAQTLIEPLFIYSKDLVVFIIFVFGLNSGIGRVAESGDYSLLNTKYRDNNYRYGFVALGLLSFALLASCYMDWWKDRLDILITFVSPFALFLIGLMFFKHKKEQYILIAGGIICTVAGIIYEYINSGSVDWALLIIPASLILGIIYDRVKLNNLIAGIISVVLSGIILLPKITDGRMFTLIESVRFLKDTGKATSWIYSSLNTSGIISSHNMWMDFARDYGIITLGILVAFELWMIYCFIRVAVSQNKSLTNYFLIASFILFNYHFMIEATAFSNKYIFALGMLIYGMICRASAEQNTKKDASEQNE